MIGQKQIHQKIQQLNFQDCHAKITQVDSQATLGNGVVVQVTGELSNAGQPMRRFTQTFVLAAQSPKKYYVHNDIFRYQDEIYIDEECDPESGRSETEDELPPPNVLPSIQEAPQPQQQALPQGQPLASYYPSAPPMPANMAVPPHHPPQLPPTVMAASAPVPAINGSVHPEDVLPAAMPNSVNQPHMNNQGMPTQHNPMAMQQNIPSPVQPTLQSSPTIAQPPMEEESKMEMQNDMEPQQEDSWCDDKNIMDNDHTTIQEDVQIQEPVISNEPKTYATLLKSGGGSVNSFASAAMMTMSNQNAKMSTSPPPSHRMDHRDQNVLGGSGAPPLGQRNSLNRGPRPLGGNNTGPRNMPRQDSRGTNRTSFNDDNEERRRSQSSGIGIGGGNIGGNNSQYADNHQLFLGNLPHSATEDDLRELFSQFGNIVELRIHSKSGNKVQPGVRVPPNYGFITYEDQVSVQNCLVAKPLFFPPNGDNQQKLNVEEKKARPRPPMDGGRLNNSGPDNQGLGRPNSGMGQRPGGPGGMMRGGPGGMGGHRGPPRGGGGNFQRGSDNRGPNMNRGSGGGAGTNSYNNRR